MALRILLTGLFVAIFVMPVAQPQAQYLNKVDPSTLPDDLKPPWQNVARRNISAYLNNLNRTIGRVSNMVEFYDAQGNRFFRNERGKMIIAGPVTPFRRPASPQNIEYYYHRAVYLWERGYYALSAVILREIISLEVPNDHQLHAFTQEYRAKAITFIQKLKKKFGRRFNSVYESIHTVFNEYLYTKGSTPAAYGKAVNLPTFFQIAYPIDWSLKTLEQRQFKDNQSYNFTLDPRPDFLVQVYEQKVKRIDQQTAYPLDDYYRYVVEKKTDPAGVQVEPFRYHIQFRLTRWNFLKYYKLERLFGFALSRRGFSCTGLECKSRHSTFTATPVPFANELAGAKHLKLPRIKTGLYRYERQEVYRQKLVDVISYDYVVMLDRFSYTISLEVLAEYENEGRTAYWQVLRDIHMYPPL